jgi:hypothetical protein
MSFMPESHRKHERSRPVQRFLDAARASFAASDMDADAAGCVRRVFALLGQAGGAGAEPPGRLPACAHLAGALRTAGDARPDLARTARAFAAIEPALAWVRRSDGPRSSPNFMDGHANALVVGPGGLEQREDVWVGVSLLAPGVRYPDHRHSPEEVYLVLSPGDFRQGDADWFTPGIGGTLFNVPDILHAMRSGEMPLFALWCLRPEPA